MNTVALLLLITVNKRSFCSLYLRKTMRMYLMNKYWSVLGNFNVAISNQTLSVLVL